MSNSKPKPGQKFRIPNLDISVVGGGKGMVNFPPRNLV